jgi:ABC-type transport system involved in multi-copper enzyme maturation permease subunit
VNGALVGRTFRRHRSVFLALVLGLIGIEVFFVHMMAAFEAGPGILEVVELLPSFVQSFVNSQIDQIGELSFPVLVVFGFQHPAVMMAASAYVILVATSPAGDRDSGSIDLFLARPIPRRTYLASTLAGVVQGVLGLPLAVLAGSLTGLATVEAPVPVAWTDLLPAAAGFSTLLAAIGGFALLVTTMTRRRGTAIAAVLGALILLYIVDTMANISPGLAGIEGISPFHYYKPIQSFGSTPTPLVDPLVLLGVFVVTTAGAFHRFARRDA